MDTATDIKKVAAATEAHYPPADFVGEGLFIGGGYHVLVDGALHMPVGGDWSTLTSLGFTRAPAGAAQAPAEGVAEA